MYVLLLVTSIQYKYLVKKPDIYRCIHSIRGWIHIILGTVCKTMLPIFTRQVKLGLDLVANQQPYIHVLVFILILILFLNLTFMFSSRANEHVLVRYCLRHSLPAIRQAGELGFGLSFVEISIGGRGRVGGGRWGGPHGGLTSIFDLPPSPPPEVVFSSMNDYNFLKLLLKAVYPSGLIYIISP